MYMIENYYKKRKRFYDYVAGFIDGEASFTISVKKEPTTRFGYAIDPEFKVSQLKSKIKVLEFVKQAIGCGTITEKSGQENMAVLVVKNRKLIIEKVIPFFRKHKLIVKEEEFNRFAKVVFALENKTHQTEKGFIEILKLVFQGFSDENRKYKFEEIVTTMKRPSETIR